MCRLARWLVLVVAIAQSALAETGGHLTSLTDFEPGSSNPFNGGVVEAQPALSGQGALRVEPGSLSIESPLDWSAYDFLHADVFNPGPSPVTVWMEVRDAQTKGYWTRVNLTTLLPPGRSTFSMPTGLYVGEKARPGRLLLKDQITRFALTVGEGGPVYFDNFRYEVLDTSAIRFPGLVALDFGAPGSPVLEGFTGFEKQPWSETNGLGWVDAKIWRSVNALQPEPLTQDFVCPESGTFRIRVSNGLYRVGFNCTSPKGYWGESQTYRSRQITVNGVAAVEDEQSFAEYLARYFKHADGEDLPGVSAFDRYVRDQLVETWVSTEVTNGFLDLTFAGGGWAICLTHLVVYPAAQDEAGERFRTWALERRRFNFENYFKMLPPSRSGAAAPAEGYRLFHRHFMDQVGPTDGPRAGEELASGTSLAANAAPGEEVAVTFSVQPAATLSAPAATLAGSFNNAEGVALDPASLQLGWVDYRLSRVTMDGSIYDVRPRYWRTGAPPVAPGITRRYWLRWQPVGAVQPGVYTGNVALAGGEIVIPVALEVLPFALDPVERLAVGPWGSGIGMGWFGDDPATGDWNDRMFESALDVLKRHGWTSLSARPHVGITFTDGGFALDTRTADREMDRLKAKGFRHLISSYGIQKIGYNLYQGPTADELAKAGFTNAVDFLRAFYQRLEAHSIEKDWLPVAWNLCDEPIGGDIPPAMSNAALHRAAASGLSKHTFMGATSMRGNDTNDAHYALVQALPMPTLTLHDEESLGVIKASRNRFAYYNGGDRWTYGRYMKMLEDRHQLELRLNWHYNVAVGDPYYALDCREDDYCWYNTNPQGELIPSLSLLQDMVPGLMDYRYLLTLENALERNPDSPGAGAAREILASVQALRAGTDARAGSKRLKTGAFIQYDAEREQVVKAILGLRERN